MDTSASQPVATPTEVIEPLTGSSVIFEPDSPTLPPSPEKAPGPLQRLDQRPDQDLKKLAAFLIALIVLIFSIILIVIFGRSSHADYSTAYFLAKDLKKEVQLIRNDSSCAKVVDYVNKSFVSASTFSEYLKDCNSISDGPDQYLSQLGQTDGVTKDPTIKLHYDAFVDAYHSAASGSQTLSLALDQYAVWHQWVLASSANTSEISWTDSELESTAKILTDSNVPTFVAYGKAWLKYFGGYVLASREYYTASFSDEHKEELREAMTSQKKAYEDWKAEQEPDLASLIPLENPDTANLYVKFEALYNAIREAYQLNYDQSIGGCKELASQVVCD